jgi:hypothetical protein
MEGTGKFPREYSNLITTIGVKFTYFCGDKA